MKSRTDQHWDTQAVSVTGDAEVNIADIYQRELENMYILKHLKMGARVLEAGCGNGYSTDVFRRQVGFVDAFDKSEEMINRAKQTYGETNNRFFTDDVLELGVTDMYDAVICVRVLINLRNLDQQLQAVNNLTARVKPGGLFILVEGFTDGFHYLNKLRNQVGLDALKPAGINYYSSIKDIRLTVDTDLLLHDQFHLGMYDYLTRVFYPMTAGDDVRHNTEISRQSMRLAMEFNPSNFYNYSRVHGFVFRRNGGEA